MRENSQGRSADQGLRRVRPIVRLAQEMGEGLGEREILFTSLSRCIIRIRP